MRKLLVFALVLGVAGAAMAYDLGNQMPAKSDPIVPENVPNPQLQGGDTIFDATVIPAVPYSDTGTTAGYNDDYDEVCPYTGSTSPDVVYTYTPAATEAIDVDLCGSSYDTKLYMYDSGLGLVACNDDFYFDDVCGVYVSKLENVTVNAGEQYYIVVDGYGGDFGDYIIDIIAFEPCVLECPGYAMLEGEPELMDNYEDSYNGGCNSNTVRFQHIPGNGDGEATFCGVAGWYLYQGSNYRDTDWFDLTMGPTGSIDVTIDAESTIYFFELFPQDCASVAVAQQALAGPCNEAFMTISGYAEGQTVWGWAGSDVFAQPPGFPDNEYDYILWFQGLFAEVATQNTSWSNVKAIYE